MTQEARLVALAEALGQDVKALSAGTGGGGPSSVLTAWKKTDTSRVSTSDSTPDPELAVPMAPNTMYRVEATLVTVGDASADMKVWITAPSDAVIEHTSDLDDVDQIPDNSGDRSLLALSTTARHMGHWIGTVESGATGGACAVAWGQNVASAAAVTMCRRSHLVLTRLGPA